MQAMTESRSVADEEEGEITKEQGKLSEVVDMFVICTVMMVSQWIDIC